MTLVRSSLLALVLLLATLPARGADPLEGWYVRPAVGTQFLTLEGGYWLPYAEIDISGAGGGCNLCLLLRAGASLSRTHDDGEWVMKVHGDIGHGTERWYALIGPFVAVGDAASSTLGVRAGGGIHLRENLAVEAVSEFLRGSAPQHSVAVIWTF